MLNQQLVHLEAAADRLEQSMAHKFADDRERIGHAPHGFHRGEVKGSGLRGKWTQVSKAVASVLVELIGAPLQQGLHRGQDGSFSAIKRSRLFQDSRVFLDSFDQINNAESQLRLGLQQSSGDMKRKRQVSQSVYEFAAFVRVFFDRVRRQIMQQVQRVLFSEFR